MCFTKLNHVTDVANKANPSIPIVSLSNHIVDEVSGNAKPDVGGAYEMSKKRNGR